MAESDDDFYPCIGVCMADPDSGHCLGCGRPPLASPTVVAEAVPTGIVPGASGDDDTPAPG